MHLQHNYCSFLKTTNSLILPHARYTFFRKFSMRSNSDETLNQIVTKSTSKPKDSFFQIIKPLELPKAEKYLREMFGNLAEAIGSDIEQEMLHSTSFCHNFFSPDGNSEGLMKVIRGVENSQVDRIIVSWLHCQLPIATIKFFTFVVFMGPKTDKPHLLFEFQFRDETQMIAVMDLIPRKDLVLHTDYLKDIYGSKLTSIYKELDKEPFLTRYVPKSLFIRSATSPVSCIYQFDAQDAARAKDGIAEISLEHVVEEIVLPTARKILEFWTGLEREFKVNVEYDSRVMAERDLSILRNGIEKDLSSNLPPIFGQEVTETVLEAIRVSDRT